MDVLNWVQLAANLVLVIITGIYVYLTKRILDSTIRQSKLVSNPVVGIRLGHMWIFEVYGPSRRNLSIGLNLTNVGNAPAIEVLVDAEIILQYSNIQGEKVIPGRFEPSSIPFIRPGEEITEDSRYNPNFGNTCIRHLLDDFRECHRLNMHRIETDPAKEPYNASMLRVCVYYRNNLGQYFESTYETYLHLGQIPEDDEATELAEIYVPTPKFYAGPISKKEMGNDISSRNSKRDLCGW